VSEPSKIDLFHPQQPHIPGVTSPDAQDHDSSAAAISAQLEKVKFLVLLIWVTLTVGGIALSGGAMFWFSQKRAARPVATTPVVAPTVDLSVPKLETTKPDGHLPIGPGIVATAAELAKPWSSRQFVFHNSLTSDYLPAIVVHVPGGDLWAISLREPFGNCDMEYVTDLKELKTKYNFAASHPMVADPCNGAIFDLATYGPGTNGMVRGEIVSGTAVRPPMAIRVERQGKDVVVAQME
jgi:hypothetical protein